jgi:L-threonylcarbamoyladenylate synthase
LIAFPTETVYGLAGLFGERRIRDRIYAAKGRPENLPLPVQVGSVSDLRRWWPGLAPEVESLATRFCPGPMTMVLPVEGGTIGVRIPDHPVALAVLAAVGRPLWVTSANRSGLPPSKTADEVALLFKDDLAWLIEGAPACRGLASTVVDLTDWPLRWKILRTGPIDSAEIEKALRMPPDGKVQG